MQTIKCRYLWPAAAAMALFSVSAQAQSPGKDTAAEVQRGVPGVDVDTNVNGRPRSNGVPGVDMSVGNPARNNGVPGVDVDVDTRTSASGRNNGVPGVDVDTRASRSDSSVVSQRSPRADRN